MTAKIAIVGAGPSGCYTAQALLKRAPHLKVDVIDAQPTPYGLVRYGVAADHQGTKQVARQFERVFTRQNARFLGNIQIGQDVGLDQLRAAYDAVVIAAGLSQDRALGVPGDDHPGITGAGVLTRALYEHPKAAPLPKLGDTPVIIGMGNVAMDILRQLSKTPDELQGSDLGPGPTKWLAAQRLKKIVVLGRSSAQQAKFDPVMIKELAQLSSIDLRLFHLDGTASDNTGRIAALNAVAQATSGPLQIEFRFNSTPTAITSTDTGITLHTETPAGPEQVPGSALISAIGFEADGTLDREGLKDGLPDKSGESCPVYTAGWFRNGPVGAIAKCRTEAQALAEQILAKIVPDPARIGGALFVDLPDVVNFKHWQRIDAHEVASAPANRCRQKIPDTAKMLRLATAKDA